MRKTILNLECLIFLTFASIHKVGVAVVTLWAVAPVAATESSAVLAEAVAAAAFRRRRRVALACRVADDPLKHNRKSGLLHFIHPIRAQEIRIHYVHRGLAAAPWAVEQGRAGINRRPVRKYKVGPTRQVKYTYQVQSSDQVSDY